MNWEVLTPFISFGKYNNQNEKLSGWAQQQKRRSQKKGSVKRKTEFYKITHSEQQRENRLKNKYIRRSSETCGTMTKELTIVPSESQKKWRKIAELKKYLKK